MDRTGLEAALDALGAVLARRSERYELVLIGGGNLVLRGVVARSTKDVDILGMHTSDGRIVAIRRMPDKLAQAVADVARTYGLADDWLNIGPESLLDLGLPDGFESRLIPGAMGRSRCGLPAATTSSASSCTLRPTAGPAETATSTTCARSGHPSPTSCPRHDGRERTTLPLCSEHSLLRCWHIWGWRKRMQASDSLRSTAVDRIAAQWIALGGQLVGDPEESVVDLEAIIAVTPELAGTDDRVLGVALDWCVANGGAVNEARLRRVISEIGTSHTFAAFAAAVAAAGGPVWRRGDEVDPLGIALRGKIVVRDLASPARLIWRLRAAFGVNARADILALLLCLPAGTSPSVADVARRTRFSKRNVAIAIESMRLAGVVETDRIGNAHRVALSDGSPLRAFLPRPGISAPDWTARWTVVVALIHAAEDLADAPEGAAVVEEKLVAERAYPYLRDASLPKPDTSALGPSFAVAFDAWTRDVFSTLRTGA